MAGGGGDEVRQLTPINPKKYSCYGLKKTHTSVVHVVILEVEVPYELCVAYNIKRR